MSSKRSARQELHGRAERSRKRRYSPLEHILANGLTVAFLVTWWVASLYASPLDIPSPFDTLRRTWDFLAGPLAIDTYTSLARIILATFFALIFGALWVVIGTLVPALGLFIDGRLIPFFNSISALGWAILGVIWFGVGNFSVIFVVTAILAPFTMVNLWEGFRAIDPGLREMGVSFTRSRRRVVTLVEAPILVPYLVAAIRMSWSVAWKVAVIAEFFGSRSGIGLQLNRARQTFDTPTVFATIVIMLIFVVVFERLVLGPWATYVAKRRGNASAE